MCVLESVILWVPLSIAFLVSTHVSSAYFRNEGKYLDPGQKTSKETDSPLSGIIRH